MKRLYVYLPLGLLLIIAGLGVAPSVLSLVYLERGGRALDRALALEGRARGDDPWLAPTPLKEPTARAAAEEAISWFHRSIEADKDHAQAYRWLGRAALLLDAPDEAETAFAHYVRLRPDNPLGYWELGLAYERLVRRVVEATYWRLDLHVDKNEDWAIMPGSTEILTRSLTSAYIETPEVTIETPYCEDGDPPASCFVGGDVWSMPLVAPDAVVPITTPVKSEVLFMHPPSQATWELTLPVTPTTLTFWMGLSPQAETWWGDGVTFRVLVDGEEAFTHHLTAEQARAGWRPGRADLSAWAGETVHLTLATGAGPDGDGAGDWAGWGDVRVVRGEVKIVPSAWIRAVWEKAGVTAEDLIAIGEEAQEAGRYEAALTWYERATRMATNPRLYWLQLGRLCQYHVESNEICDKFLASNRHNLLVNPDFAIDGFGWHFNRREGAGYAITECPGLPDKKCAMVHIQKVTSPYGTSWAQCLTLTPEQAYRFSVWVKVETKGEWITLYYQGDRGGDPHGIKLGGSHEGAQDWTFFEQEFVAPEFDDHRACFHPLRLLDMGSAWFHSATLELVK